VLRTTAIGTDILEHLRVQFFITGGSLIPNSSVFTNLWR